MRRNLWFQIACVYIKIKSEIVIKPWVYASNFGFTVLVRARNVEEALEAGLDICY
jgi:hypothetical protein